MVSGVMKIVVMASYARSLVILRRHLLAALAARGHEVIALAPDDVPEVREELGRIGVAFRTIALERTGTNPWRDLRAVAGLVALLRELRPGAMLSYTAKPVIYGGLAARAAGVPHVFALVTGLGYAFIEQGTLRGRLVGALVRRLYRASLGGAEAVLFQNADDRDLFRELGLIGSAAVTKTVITDGSGVDLAAFAVAPLPARPVFLLIGRLLRDKGVVEYAAAARIVRRAVPEARCLLLGPYDTNPTALARSEIEGWVREGIVEYLGETTDVRPHIAAASVVVLPSYREGIPRSVLEGMAMGRAIVATDVPGCRQTVEDGVTGDLVPARDAEALAAAMLRLARDPEKVAAMGAAGRARAAARFGVERVTQTILAAMCL
jgi:glycosyltransferase involved in cell wall biosynthesis